MNIPKTHPRYTSLKIRERLVKGIELGITSMDGLIAHGRGEAFDYLLGEKTRRFAKEAITGAASLLLLAKHPVISVNGNTAALVTDELIALSEVLSAPLEVNVFHASKEREKKIAAYLKAQGAKVVLLPDATCTILYLDSNRKYVHKDGIYKADLVFVPLEDGDRAEALIKNGKKVITIDLNPLSRTAKTATVTIVDNITRVLPLLLKSIKIESKKKKTVLERVWKEYDNKRVLREAIRWIK